MEIWKDDDTFNDVTTAEQAVWHLKSMHSGVKAALEVCNLDETERRVYKAHLQALDIAIAKLEEKPEEPQGSKWIPCSERLPRCDENPVLVSSKEMVNIGWYSCGKWKTGTRLPMKDVIAWQPLPEPYEGEV